VWEQEGAVRMFKENMGVGDSGETYCIILKRRVRKSHVLIELVGTLDEAESAVGLAASLMPEGLGKMAQDLMWIEELLFRIGFALGGGECVSQDDVRRLEEMVREYGESSSPRGFVLHGFHPSISALSLARSVVRRLERVFVKAVDEGYLAEREGTILPIINRVGDVLYLMEMRAFEMLGMKPVYAKCSGRET